MKTVRMTKKLISIYCGHMCIFILNMKFLSLSIANCVLTANQRKVQTGCHFKTIGQNYSKSNQYILGAYVDIHTKYKVSMTVYVGRRAN